MAILGELANAGANIAGAGIGAAGSLLGTAANMVFNNWQANKQRDWNEQMMNKQNAWNEEMWEKTNEYNSPTAQMQRMRDAGLNPLFYGLDGSSASAMESAQALGYQRAQVSGIDNPVTSAMDAAMKTAQVSSIELDNDLKRKQLDWFDKEHQQEFDFKNATIDEVRKRIEEASTRIANNEMEFKLKEKDIDKKDAEIATEWAKYASLGLDNELKEQLNPLIARSKELENQLLEIRSQSEAERLLAELAETRAHAAALYAQAALDGARKEGEDLQNAYKRVESKFNTENAQNKANLLKWTSEEQRYKTSVWKNTWKGKVSVDNYYAKHYEEAFRNTWSKSGTEYGVAQNVGQAIGNAAALGIMLAF